MFKQSTLTLGGNSSAGTLVVSSATAIVDDAAALSVSGNATLSAPSITLANDAQEQLNIAGSVLLEAVGSGAIVVSAVGSYI